jgi:lysozyme family protein
LGVSIAIDGSLGATTIHAIANTKEPDLLHALRAYSVLYRFHRVQAAPDQAQFLEGWVFRDTA